jgi:SAM-dependent methyltransferase
MYSQFDAYAEYYNLFYAGKDYYGEAKYVDGLIRANKKDAVNILEFGCGSGGHARELNKYGYSVHGVDISPAMLAQAQSRIGPNSDALSFSIGDIRELALEKEFDIVLSLFHVIGYQNTNEDLINTFSSAYKHLKPGGLFIYDFWYGPTVLSDGPSNRVLHLTDSENEVIRISQPQLDLKNNLCNIKYSVFVNKDKNLYSKITEQHSMRFFFQNELSHFENKKFELISEFSWLSNKPLELGNWYGVRVCRKI